MPEHDPRVILPHNWLSWLLWFLLVALAYPFYFLHPPLYPTISQRYEQEAFRECEGEQSICDEYATTSGWTTRVKIPRYVSDFSYMPLEVQVQNNTGDAVVADNAPDSAQMAVPADMGDGEETAAVGSAGTPQTDERANAGGEKSVTIRIELISADNENARPQYEVASMRQNTVLFQAVPPEGEVAASFGLKVYGSDNGEAYTPIIWINGEEVPTPFGTVNSIEFNREKVFQLWTWERLLSPPGINIIVPLVLLAFVVLGERSFYMGAFFTYKQRWAAATNKKPGRFASVLIAVLIAAAALLLGIGLYYLLPLLLGWFIQALTWILAKVPTINQLATVGPKAAAFLPPDFRQPLLDLLLFLLVAEFGLGFFYGWLKRENSSRYAIASVIESEKV